MVTTCPLRCTLLRGTMEQGEQTALRIALLGASGAEGERCFTPGVVAGPFSIGRHGDWAIEGRGLGAVEGFLYFDGHELFACSRDEASPIVADGRPLASTWEPLPIGARLVVGRARLVVEDPTPAANSASTILTDIGALKAPPVPVRAGASPRMFASDDEHTKIGEALPSGPSLDDAPTAMFSSAVREQFRTGRPPAVSASARPSPPEASAALAVVARASRAPARAPDEAVHDGPFFSGLASSFESGDAGALSPSLPRLSGALPLYGGTSSSSVSRPAPPVAVPIAATSGRSAGPVTAFWREASPVRKATVLLLPVALAAFAFVLASPSTAPAPARSQPAPAKVAVSATETSTVPEAEALTPRILGGTSGEARAPDGGVTLERRAVDALHAHRLDEAESLYKELEESDPKNAAIRAAAAVVRPGTPAPR